MGIIGHYQKISHGEGAGKSGAASLVYGSPLGVQPVLDYEAEEARILTATARQPLALRVEESGCLSELVDDYGSRYFDVLHRNLV
ncbi:TPR repeat-containing protein [Microseira wollei NIES-4236]|uniref:TPR repeat-containing protein n=1 Tax=Microseira wollei NIES-4236 TaxID=2530354 RepID=A0AAV3WPL7_9CYAN|nr:TPR repeat-containing protein [Microseira wollei NIES-4236]